MAIAFGPTSRRVRAGGWSGGSRRGGRRALRAAARRSSSPRGRRGRTRRRPTATRRWPRRSARCPSRRPPPGSATCWSATRRDEIEGLVELGEPGPRGAGEPGRGPAPRARRRSAASWSPPSPGRRAALAYERGHSVSTAVATQVEETLRAAMADPEAGEALLSGRLTSPLSYSGMGLGEQRPHLRVVPPPKADRARRAARSAAGARPVRQRRGAAAPQGGGGPAGRRGEAPPGAGRGPAGGGGRRGRRRGGRGGGRGRAGEGRGARRARGRADHPHRVPHPRARPAARGVQHRRHRPRPGRAAPEGRRPPRREADAALEHARARVEQLSRVLSAPCSVAGAGRHSSHPRPDDARGDRHDQPAAAPRAPRPTTPAAGTTSPRPSRSPSGAAPSRRSTTRAPRRSPGRRRSSGRRATRR